MDLESRRLIKLERMMERVCIYLNKFNNEYGQKLSYKEKGEKIILHTPCLFHIFDKMRSENKDLENENTNLKSQIDDNKYYLDILINKCTLYILRKPKEVWTREVISLFLLKSFNIYNFEKCRFSSMHEKEIVADCFSVNEARLTDQINLFVNQILKENKYNIKDTLISEKDLLRWKYRLLLKEDPTLTYEDLKFKFSKGE
ncbi:hypothetical protein [uncultured Clostridium sp.]|uniref:hypothetical protein n=1 Tax=uncultured Clostridium sp. TaxID=59620 RepID=UPI002614FF08|nr:hypothetical protein [uncultured Clostridium sp.]